MIETLAQWNVRLEYCGCCPMPACPAPSLLMESKTGSAYYSTSYAPFTEPAGDPDDDLPTVYRSYTSEAEHHRNGVIQSYQTSGNPVTTSVEILTTETYTGLLLPANRTSTFESNAYDAITQDCTFSSGTGGGTGPDRFTNVELPPPECTASTKKYWTLKYEEKTGGVPLTLQGCPGPFPSGQDERYADIEGEAFRLITLINGLTKAELVTEASNEMEEDDWSGIDSNFLAISWPTIGDIGEWPDCPATDTRIRGGTVSATIRRSRFRFRIPATHAGTAFTITYDVLEEPDGWDVMPAGPARSWVSQDNVVEWIGPGTPVPIPALDEEGNITNQAAIDEALAIRLTPWVELAAPEVPGQRRIVNIRFTCYSGTKYGRKVQTLGEGVELQLPEL